MIVFMAKAPLKWRRGAFAYPFYIIYRGIQISLYRKLYHLLCHKGKHMIMPYTNIQLKEETDMRTGFASGEAGFAEHNEYIWSRSPTKHGTKPAA
jgi:hypothetical protein